MLRRFALAACVALPLGAQDPPQVFASLDLPSGKVIHHVRILSKEADGVVVTCDEGMMKVPASTLPGSGPDLVKPPFLGSPESRAPEPTPSPRPTPLPRPTPSPRPAQLESNGCTLTGFEPESFQNVLGCARVSVHNATPNPVGISPRQWVCVLEGGGRRSGRFFVADGIPPVMKRHEEIPANGDLIVLVIFANEQLRISRIEWSR